MIASIVSAALWAVLASLALSLVLGAAVLGLIHVVRPAAATRQALWSVALGAAGLAPIVILAVMVLRGAPAPADVMDDAKTAGAPGTAARPSPASQPQQLGTAALVVEKVNPIVIGAGASTRKTGLPSDAAASQNQHAAGTAPGHASHGLRLPAPPDLAPIVAESIVIVWALGALAGLIGLGRSLLRVRGLKLRSSALDGDLATDLPWLTELPGREIYLRLSYETETPIAVGFRRPVILIPTEMATAAGLTSIESLVMHEYAHLARYDDWTNLAQRAIERVFWFNPLVWILGRRLALEREVAADEAVVARTHDAKSYASTLWRMAQEMRMPEHVVVAPGAMLTRKQISVRIERLLDDAPVASRRFGAAAFATLALACTGVAALAATAPPMPIAPAAPIAPIAANTPAHVAADATASPSPGPSATLKAHAASHAVAASPANASSQAAAATTAAPHAAATIDADTDATLKPASTSSRAMVPAPPAPPNIAAPAIAAMPNASAIAEQVMNDPDVANLRNLGSQISADIHRQLAEQKRQLADQQRQVADQQHQVADQQRDMADAARHATNDRTPSGPVTRAMIAACTACDFAGRDLHGLNLSGMNLTGNDFSRANLDGANFGSSTLRGLSFSHASLRGAQFTNAKITGADFNHAKLDGSNLTNAQLMGVDLSHATMDGAVTTGIHLTGSALP